MKKRYYYEKTETTTINRKGYIEVDNDYTQLYNCFTKVAAKITSANTFKLLFWLLANKVSDSNGINCSMHSYKEYNQYLKEHCGDDCEINYRTFLRSIKDLKESGALTQVGKGHYYANPYMFWQEEVTKRTELLLEEAKDGNFTSLNP